jgi:predicted ATP-grasp superfamily ATP-dependent carboligase
MNMDLNNYHVLVLDGQWRQTLSVTRSLGRRGIKVLVGDSSRIAISKFSRYCVESITYPDPVRNPDNFIEFLIRFLRHKKIDLVIPASEITVELLSIHKSKLAEFTKIPLADHDIVVNALDKSLTFEKAIKEGIPCPRTYTIENESEISTLADKLEYPVIIKPRRSTGALGYREIYSRSDFVKEYMEVHNDFPFPLVQERIPDGGGKFSASAVFNEKGELTASFLNKQLRQFPYDAGAVTYTCSIRDDSILNHGIRLLSSLNWYGVAEVEFKVDPRDRLPKLLEINPRFWGMVEASVCSGMDLPYHVFAMSVLNDRTNYSEYRVGQYLRWLFPGEMLHFISNPERSKISKDFFNFFDKNTKYYILSKDDPLPILGVFLVSIVGIFIDDEIRASMKKFFAGSLRRLTRKNG